MKVIGTDGKEYTIEPRADLDGANLRWANLSGANLNEAVWNDETVFPKGFDIPDELRGLAVTKDTMFNTYRRKSQ